MIRAPGAETAAIPAGKVEEKDPTQAITENVVRLREEDRVEAEARIKLSEEEGRWVEEASDHPEDRPTRHYRRLLVEAGDVSIVVVVDVDPGGTVEDNTIAIVGFTSGEVAKRAVANRDKLDWDGLDEESRG